jgi:hypothetical protein
MGKPICKTGMDQSKAYRLRTAVLALKRKDAIGQSSGGDGNTQKIEAAAFGHGHHVIGQVGKP